MQKRYRGEGEAAGRPYSIEGLLPKAPQGHRMARDGTQHGGAVLHRPATMDGLKRHRGRHAIGRARRPTQPTEGTGRQPHTDRHRQQDGTQGTPQGTETEAERDRYKGPETRHQRGTRHQETPTGARYLPATTHDEPHGSRRGSKLRPRFIGSFQFRERENFRGEHHHPTDFFPPTQRNNSISQSKNSSQNFWFAKFFCKFFRERQER